MSFASSAQRIHTGMRAVETMHNLDPEILDYKIEHLGENAAVAIAQMLDADQPLLFYLWQPHALLAPSSKYKLERVQLPVYTPSGYQESKTDCATRVVRCRAAVYTVGCRPGRDPARLAGRADGGGD